MPCDYKKYDPKWKSEIRPRILERDGYRCKKCGVHNYAVGHRTEAGSFQYEGGNLYWDSLQYTNSYREAKEALEHAIENWAMNDDEGRAKPIIIVLTIAHLDHNTTNNADENLAALCQRCHLRHDIEHHKKNSRATIEKKKGLQSLFPP